VVAVLLPISQTAAALVLASKSEGASSNSPAGNSIPTTTSRIMSPNCDSRALFSGVFWLG